MGNQRLSGASDVRSTGDQRLPQSAARECVVCSAGWCPRKWC